MTSPSLHNLRNYSVLSWDTTGCPELDSFRGDQEAPCATIVNQYS
ncbi:MAG: hypothetical protein P8P83_04550 [Rickettsiaceae bacterium]|nr:hypothetical protein [Rickettsiaceae bacterium]